MADGDETPTSPGPPDGTAPWAGHTRWQLFIRSLFSFLGPSQTGLPPYPTPEEREEHRRANAPVKRVRESRPPPGYRFETYTDGAGTVHRTLVRDRAEPPPNPDRAPEG
jgi:hypothetical protein